MKFDASLTVGNTTNNGNAAFTYNDRNRMSSAIANGVTTNFEINALGQRVKKSNSGGETQFIYDLSGKLIAEADAAGTIVVEYAYLDGEPLAMWRDDEGDYDVPLVIPDLPTLIAPLETVTTASPTFSWEHLGGAVDRYTLQVFDRTVLG